MLGEAVGDLPFVSSPDGMQVKQLNDQRVIFIFLSSNENYLRRGVMMAFQIKDNAVSKLQLV